MPVTIGALRESAPGETRVSLVPGGRRQTGQARARACCYERGAGARAQLPGRAVQERRVGRLAPTRCSPQADVLLTVQPLTHRADRARSSPARVVVGFMQPHARARRGRGARATRHHQLRDGTGAAHLARAVDGRPVLAGRHRRLQGGADRRQHTCEVLADADHRRRHDPPGAGADHRRRRRRTAGHRHRQAPRRRGRGLRRAQRHHASR